MVEVSELFVKRGKPIRETIGIMDRAGLGIAFVIDEDNGLLGTVSDGDIRRAIRKGIDTNTAIETVMNPKPITMADGSTNADIEELIEKLASGFTKNYLITIPIINESNKVTDAIIHSIGSKKFRLLHQAEGFPFPTNVKRVLVVGGAGYLGSVITRKLLEQGYQVRVLDLLMYGEEPLLELMNNPKFQLLHGDLRNISTVTKALEDVDAVIHLAAIVGDPAGKEKPLHTIETNYLAALTLAEACKYNQINRFIFASTCSVYGVGQDSELDENASLHPVSLYARSKIESEKAILRLADENFSPTILRMGTLYGLSPRMRFDLVVNLFAMKTAIDEEISIFGGHQWRPFLHVEDAANAYLKCLEAPIEKVNGQVFNVGSNEQNLQISQLGSVVRELFPAAKISVEAQEQIDGQADQRDYRVSFNKIRGLLGFEPTKTIHESIKDINSAIAVGKISNVRDRKHYNINF